MGRWGHDSMWAQDLRHVIFSVIPKAKAKTDTQMRSIGLLPYIYRAWKAIRKIQSERWSLGVHGVQHV